MATTRKCETCNDQYQNKNLPPCGGCRRYRKWTPQKRPPASEPAPHLLDCGHSSEHLELPPVPIPDFEGDGPEQVHTMSGAFCSECRKITRLELLVKLAIGFKDCESCSVKNRHRFETVKEEHPCFGCGEMEHWVAKGGG